MRCESCDGTDEVVEIIDDREYEDGITQSTYLCKNCREE